MIVGKKMIVLTTHSYKSQAATKTVEECLDAMCTKLPKLQIQRWIYSPRKNEHKVLL